MSVTPQDVQTKLDAAVSALKATTSGYPAMVKRYGPDWLKWPVNSNWYRAFDALRIARIDVGGLVSPPEEPPTPPPIDPESFLGVTSWDRPAFTIVRPVPFKTEEELDNAIADMKPGDYIHYAGLGVLTISSSTTSAYKILNKNPAGPVVIDFGCARNMWDPSKITPNYVKFAYTGTQAYEGLFIENCSNLRLYGGEMTTGNVGGVGYRIYGTTHHCRFEDFFVSKAGGSGFAVQAHVGSPIHDIIARGEVTRWAMNPARDSHGDKGTGLHAFILHGESGATFKDSVMCVHASNPLQPGETSCGKVWPEGAGGYACEFGHDQGDCSGNIGYAYGKDLNMRPGDGMNPGSDGTHQAAGHVGCCWGNASLAGLTWGWLEGHDCSGAVLFNGNGNWHNFSPAVKVLHGRHSNMNKYTQFANAAPNNVPYPKRYNVEYSDDCV